MVVLGGRSILEVHNIPRKATLAAKPQLGPTVVLNSNLVVRGIYIFQVHLQEIYIQYSQFLQVMNWDLKVVR